MRDFLHFGFTFDCLDKTTPLNTSGFFETFFSNSRFNGIIIMDTQGFILNMNEAFHLRFGYLLEDLAGKHLSVLFTEKDKAMNKPETEVQNVLRYGSANDENYLINRQGHQVWVTGESVLIKDEDETYIVKVVHNIHAQKQLERFLLQSHEFIETVFESVDQAALLILDSRLRVIKTNKAFLEIFELDNPVAQGSRLTEIDHPFWHNPEVKQQAVSYLTMNNKTTEKIFDLKTKSGVMKELAFRAKLIEGTIDAERKLLIMVKFVS